MTAHPIILDTNLLVLYVVGAASRDYISKHKRLSAFTAKDYDTLLTLVSHAPAVLVTPNTLTETSNLAGCIGEPARSKVFKVLQDVIAVCSEEYVPSRMIAKHREFVRLGLTDAALIEMSSKDLAIVTTDFNLYRTALAKGTPAINFNHLRDQYL